MNDADLVETREFLKENLILRESGHVPSRREQSDIAKQVIQAVVDGDVNPLQLRVFITGLKNVLDEITENEEVRRLVLEEARKYPKGERLFGARIDIKRKTLYDYKKDQVWTRLDAEKKAREKLLKSIDPTKPLADTQTGELIESAFAGETEYIMADFKEDK